MNTLLEKTNVSGRFTLPELERLIGTLMWSRGVPETVTERERMEMRRLIELAREYIDGIEGAYAVDIVENQILNVCVHEEMTGAEFPAAL